MQQKEERSAVTVPESEFASELGLETIYSPERGINFSTMLINRPGLVLAGYTDYFAASRIQVLGKVETMYLATLKPEKARERYEFMFTQKIPCLIFARNLPVPDGLVPLADKYKIPIFRSPKVTANLTNELYNYMIELLADQDTLHGILLDINGIGVLLTGESGIGKSETALELIHRGHRLVSDDVVEVKEIKNCIFGRSPVITKNLMEVRGIGIMDVRALYGVGAVISAKRIKMCIEFQKWDETKEFSRITNMTKVTILGVELPKYVIPATPGRNLAILTEVAVRAFRLHEEGYDVMSELDRRMES
jgi:Serine kinase of the HPr protein, regulates carbohydrate metabolism